MTDGECYRRSIYRALNPHMDCAVEDDGSIVLVIDEWVGECNVRFWKSRSSNSDLMARCRGCSTDYPPHINDGVL